MSRINARCKNYIGKERLTVHEDAVSESALLKRKQLQEEADNDLYFATKQSQEEMEHEQ